MQKNVAGQKWRVFAFDETDNTAKTGEASNISGSVYIDGIENIIDDTNPTEIKNGYYDFNISQAESNGNILGIIAECATANIQVIGVPGTLITTPENYITKIDHLDRDISSGCAAGDEMNLVDDAITASKFDETTAFPIVSTDTGDTQIARTGADGDTLETISDEIADLTISGGASAQQVWEYGERILSAPDNITSDNEKINQAQLNLIQNISGASLIDVDTGVNNIEAKLPDNYIMGSSDQTDKDDEIDLISTVNDKIGTPVNASISNDIASGQADLDNIQTRLPTSLTDGRINANVGAISGVSQRATDLAEISQYLLANSLTLTDIIADNSVMAQLLATSGDISGYDNTTDAQQGIRDAIVESSPQNHVATANTETTGTLDSGTYSDTATINTTYWQTSPAGVAVGGFGLNVDLDFNIGVGRVPNSLEIVGYFDSGAQRTVQVWAYDYNVSAYVQISSSVNDFRNTGSNETYQYSLTHNMVNTATGAVNIRFTSESITTGDDWYVDFVGVTSVAQAAAGLTTDAIQAAVWARSSFTSEHDEHSLGYVLSNIYLVEGDIVSATSASQFIIDGDYDVDDAYNGMVIVVEDETTGFYEARRIIDYIGSTKEVFLDRALSFTPEEDDDFYIMGTGYADVNVTHIENTSPDTYISTVLSGSAIPEINEGVNNIEDKLPTNYIMGSSDQTDKDDDIDLLTSRLSADRATYLDYLSGGAVALESSINQIKGIGWTDENLVTIDSLIDTIKSSTDNLPGDPASETNVDATETKVDALLTRLSNARAGFLDYLSGGAVALEASINQIKGAEWTDENITTIEGLINDFTAKLPTNYIMGSSDQTDKDDEIDYIVTQVDVIESGVSAINISAQDVWEYTDRQLTGADNVTSDGETIDQNKINYLDEPISSGSAPSVEEIRDGILDDATRFSGANIDALISSRGSEAKQDIMTTHLTDLKGDGFVKATHSNKAIIDTGNLDWITGSGLSGANTLTIITKNQLSTNVVECAIEVWDSAGTSFYERKSSDTSGQAIFNADDGTYTIKMHKAGYTFENALILVNSDTSVTYTGTEFTPGTPASPNECRVYEYLKPQGVTGFPTSVQATAKIISLPYDSGNYLHAGSLVGGTYNASNGLLYWDIVQGATVEFNIKGYGLQDDKIVPYSGSAILTEIS